MQRKQKGFTLVEILIVVIILGILAAIIIPQFTEASGEAKESNLASNLQTLKSQCELYKVQHNDLYPWDDAAGGFVGTDVLVQRLTSYSNADATTIADAKDVANGVIFGPYFQNVPTNPFCDNVDPVTEEPLAVFEYVLGGPATDSGDFDWTITDITSNSLLDGYPGASGRD